MPRRHGPGRTVIPSLGGWRAAPPGPTTSHMQVIRTRARVALIGLLAIAATACGSAASTPAGSSSPPPSPQALIRQLLPRSVAGTHLIKVQMETLKHQLQPPGYPKKAQMDAIVRRSWLASGHSLFQLNTTRVAVLVTVNLFKTTTDSKRFYHLDITTHDPHERFAWQRVPAGSSPGTRYACIALKGDSGCILLWRQGRLISQVAIVGKGPSALNPGVGDELGPRLRAVQVQVANRIVRRLNVLPGS